MSNPKWSYSRFSTFQSCRNKYNLQYIKELIVIGKEVEVADKGLSFHQIAEQMNSKISLEELTSIAIKDLKDREFDQEKYPILKAIPRLYCWWHEFIIPFENQGFTLYKETWERGIILEKPIVGALDTLLINDKTKEVRIYDFKTGKKPDASSYKNQLLLYAYLIGKRLNIEKISEKIKIFVFFPLANIDDNEVTNIDLAKKQSMKMMKQIIYSEEDVLKTLSEFEEIIKEDSTINWEKADPRIDAKISFACSWCNFAGSKQYCPISYDSGCRFPRKAQIMTKEEYEKIKNKAS